MDMLIIGVINMKKSYDEEFKKLGLNIAYHRKARGLSQLQLAEMVNISRTHLSNVEGPNSHTSLSLDTLFAIAEALDVSAAQLLDFTR